MDIKNIIDVVFHIGDFLKEYAQTQSIVCYAIAAFIIFFETGFVVIPFLPGDSLIFTAGTLAATGSFNIWLIILILGLAAIVGDTTNYFIGRYLGLKLFTKEKSFFFNKKYLIHTQNFYERHGRKTIIIARFVPIVRSFAPFVAGIGKMKYGRFVTYNIVGGFGWVIVLGLLGFLFGNLPLIRDHFSLVLSLIIIISALPVFVGIARGLINKGKSAQIKMDS